MRPRQCPCDDGTIRDGQYHGTSSAAVRVRFGLAAVLVQDRVTPGDAVRQPSVFRRFHDVRRRGTHVAVDDGTVEIEIETGVHASQRGRVAAGDIAVEIDQQCTELGSDICAPADQR